MPDKETCEKTGKEMLAESKELRPGLPPRYTSPDTPSVEYYRCLYRPK